MDRYRQCADRFKTALVIIICTGGMMGGSGPVLGEGARSPSTGMAALGSLGGSEFRPPPSWEAVPLDRMSYPQLLGWARRGQGEGRAVMTLVGRRLQRGTTVKQFAAEIAAFSKNPKISNLRKPVLLSEDAVQRIQVDAVLDGSKAVRAQYFVLSPPAACAGWKPEDGGACRYSSTLGYVLTLVAPLSQAPARYRDLEDTAGTLLEGLIVRQERLLQAAEELLAPIPKGVPDGGTPDGGPPDGG